MKVVGFSWKALAMHLAVIIAAGIVVDLAVGKHVPTVRVAR